MESESVSMTKASKSLDTEQTWLTVQGVPDDRLDEVLVLGCGDWPVKGADNHDRFIYHDHVNLAWDLNEIPWPVPEESYHWIVAMDVLEHLNSFLDFFNEAWRVLDKGGRAMIQTVSWRHENAWRDPTHVRPYHVDSFRYLDPDTFWGKTFSMYTDKKWKVLTVQDTGNIWVELEKRE